MNDFQGKKMHIVVDSNHFTKSEGEGKILRLIPASIADHRARSRLIQDVYILVINIAEK